MLQHNRQNRTRNYEVNIPVKKLSVIQSDKHVIINMSEGKAEEIK